jgi:hypothetical protein
MYMELFFLIGKYQSHCSYQFLFQGVHRQICQQIPGFNEVCALYQRLKGENVVIH